MSKAPEPVRKRVTLVNSAKKVTVHHYVGTVPVKIDGVPYWSFQFACFETGIERRYGIADRFEYGAKELDDEIAREGN